MKGFTRSAAFLSSLLLASSTSAITLVERNDGSAPKVIQQDIHRRQIADPIQHDRARFLRKRADTVQVGLENEETLYFMNVTLGTPGQTLALHIDTGSSDLWVNVANSSLCEQNAQSCAAAGTYDASKSNTYEYIDGDFNISYVDGSGAAGQYASDVLQFADVTLEHQQFGIGQSSSSLEGIIGIGYTANEVAATTTDGQYPNVPAALVQNGYIGTNAYSLWLNDLDASTGSILFGGVDTSKYTGSLQSLPIVSESGVYAEFIIAITAFGANGTEGSISSGLNYAALLDSGTSLMYLPDQIADSIFSSVGAQYDASQGAAFIDCSMSNSDATIDFTFSSPTISVSMSELVIVAGFNNGQPVCILGIGKSGATTCVLGDTFLRSAYVVYDLQNNQIALAQTDFNSSDPSNIQEISNGSSIPDATVVQNAVTSVALAGDGARLDGQPTVTLGSLACPTAAIGYDLAVLAAGAAGLALAL